MNASIADLKVAIEYRCYGKKYLLDNVFPPLLERLAEDLKPHLDDAILDREPKPPQRDGGPKEPTMFLDGVSFLAILIVVGASLGGWGLNKVWDAFLGKSVEAL